MNREQYGPGISTTDLAMNMLAAFICLFMLSFIMMTKKIIEIQKLEVKAEFLITSIWPEDSNNDIDLYVQDPSGNLVFFRAREKGLMHLDRDDLGKSNDKFVAADGTVIEVKENREIVSLRGIVPGEYIVGVHMYLRKDTGESTPVTIKLEKINPVLKTITMHEIKLGPNGDEKTAFRFTLDSAGDVTNITQLEKKLAVPTPNAYQYSNPDNYGGP